MNTLLNLTSIKLLIRGSNSVDLIGVGITWAIVLVFGLFLGWKDEFELFLGKPSIKRRLKFLDFLFLPFNDFIFYREVVEVEKPNKKKSYKKR